VASPTQKENQMNRFKSLLFPDGSFSREYKKSTIILLGTPVILITFKYFGMKNFYINHLAQIFVISKDIELTSALYTFFASFILLGWVPALIIKFVFREPLSVYGVQLGDLRFGMKSFLLLAPVAIALAYLSSQTEPFLLEYPLYKEASSSPWMFVAYSVSYLMFYLGWEFFFRGYMQFGLEGAFGGWNAILVQTLASCLLHIGKPPTEIYGSILAGIVWGMMAWRGHSLLSVILLHWLLGVSLDFFISYF
jgi:membrane protease YdiL (CAAX protease family)